MPDAAVVKDVTNPTDAAKPAGTTTDDKPMVDLKDTDALEVGKLLLESGYTKDQINDVLNAPRALEAMRYAVKNDPEAFIRSLEQADPGAGENFLDKLSKLYVDRYDRSGGSDGKDKDGKDSALMGEVSKLREEVTTLRTASQRSAAAAAQAQIQARFDARVDDLFGQLPKDKFPVSDYEKGLIKGALEATLAKDAKAVERVMNGNFVDVPQQFSRILTGMAEDRKARADAETKARERTNASASPMFEGGPIELPKDFTTVPDSTNADDIWNIDPLVKVLEGTR